MPFCIKVRATGFDFLTLPENDTPYCAGELCRLNFFFSSKSLALMYAWALGCIILRQSQKIKMAHSYFYAKWHSKKRPIIFFFIKLI